MRKAAHVMQFIFSTAIIILIADLAAAQPTISSRGIPRQTKADVRSQILKLYSRRGWDRYDAVKALDGQAAAARRGRRLRRGHRDDNSGNPGWTRAHDSRVSKHPREPGPQE